MLGEIQALNHLGVYLIDGGDYEEAAEVFCHAITLLSGCSLQPTPIDGCNRDAGVLDRFVTVYALEEDDTCTDVAKSDFYSCPFHFEFSEQAHPDEVGLTSEQYNSSAITCLFNLGLCFHLQWEESKTHTFLVQKALSFYEQAISLTSKSAPAPCDPVLKVLMAVCTNATHCNNELANLEHAGQWNRTLKTIINFAKDKDMLCADHFFSINAFFNSFGRVAAHAA